ncbi:MAG: hypothetical protein M3071_00055, partial [Actinomycetota bacterium]|nr:hypothetical protein [Actinomycetota bacterium]
RSHVASLRAVDGRAGGDPEVRELVDHVPAHSSGFVHPLIGQLTFDCQILTAAGSRGRLARIGVRERAIRAGRSASDPRLAKRRAAARPVRGPAFRLSRVCG